MGPIIRKLNPATVIIDEMMKSVRQPDHNLNLKGRYYPDLEETICNAISLLFSFKENDMRLLLRS